MKHIIKTIPLLLTFLIGALFAQYPVNWINYDVINPVNDETRSAAYNPVTDHVLVASRMGGAKIIILSAETGDSLGQMSVEGLIDEKNTYLLNQISVADDGTIYLCNLSAPVYTPGSTFKVYRYENEFADPVLVFEDNLENGRYGDALRAVGEGDNKYIYSSGQGNDKLVVLRDEGGEQLIFDKYVALPQPGNARHGISPVKPGGKIWINGADSGYPPPALITADGQLVAVVPDSIFSAGGTSTIKYTRIGKYNIVSVLNAFHATVSSAQYTEDELGTVLFDYFGDDYFSNPEDTTALFYKTGWMGNINATGTIDYDWRRNSLIVLLGTNSLSSLSLERLLRTSTPRDSIWTVTIDGQNDFYPSDLVGRQGEHKMYMTWSAGKVFVGVTGHTLIDPTETNRMYVAFDLDPEGENGSMVPPEPAANVQNLPFKADVVFMIEPWKEPDYLIGTIYKWNGSSWQANYFDGNIASQGALAFADEGEFKLAEFAAILNENGLGTDFDNLSMMVYVAEKETTGQVLCAFPDKNQVGNGVSFSHYFYLDALANGIFPNDTTKVQIKNTATAIKQGKRLNVETFTLKQNYPNPFNPTTTIRYYLSKRSKSTIKVYDVLGREVFSVTSKAKSSRWQQVMIDGTDWSSGIYYYQLLINNKAVQTRKMVLIK